MRQLIIAGIVTGLILSQGCSAFQPKTQSIIIRPTDPTAEVLVDGQNKGTGTVSVDLDRNRSHSVIAKSGNQTGSALIDKKISTTGVLDIIGTCIFIIPAIGLFTPGFWELDPQHVDVVVPAK